MSDVNLNRAARRAHLQPEGTPRPPGPPRVAIGFPYYKHWEGDMGMSAVGVVARSAAKVAMLPIASKGCYIEDNRNGIVTYAHETNIPFDYLLWWDTDIVVPDTALLRLLAHDKDIVGVNYRQRVPPYSFVGFYEDGSDRHLLEPGLHRMKHLPAGFILVKWEIYKTLKGPWYLAPSAKGDPRDEVYFCRQAEAAGFEIWCDHDLTRETAHIGEQSIGWFSPDQIKPVEIEGAYINFAKHEQDARKRAEKSYVASVEEENDFNLMKRNAAD